MNQTPNTDSPADGTNTDPHKLGRILALCLTLGVVSGIGAIIFYGLLDFTQFIFLEYLAGFHPKAPANEPLLFHAESHEFRRWLILFIPAVGGLVAGWIASRIAPETAGHGTDNAIEAYHFRDGAVRTRVPFAKALASAFTIGTGGSGGAEGPITQIGAGFGAILAQRLGLAPSERRTLMAAGMAAGIAAIFRAPLSGALFAAEVFYKDLDVEHEVLIPAFIASTIAYSTFALAFGWEPLFATPLYVFDNPIRLIFYFILALVEAAAAIAFIRFFYLTHDIFARIRMPVMLKPALGGLAVGVIGYFMPDTLGTGYGLLQEAMQGNIAVKALMFLAVGKIITSSLSIGSGGSGGLFGPSVVIGGLIGGVVGIVAERLFPNIGIHPGAFVIVGMGGFFAAAANCPISTILLVSEVTGNYRLLVPSMFVCIIAYVLTRKHSLYRSQLDSRLDAPSKMGNMLSAILKKIPVHRAQALGSHGTLLTIPEDMSLSQMLKQFAESDQPCFPVVGEDGMLRGVVDSSDLRRSLHEDMLSDLLVAKDLAHSPFVVRSDESLLAAVQLMAARQTDHLIVVDPSGGQLPIGLLGRSQVVRAYDAELFTAPR